MVHNIFSLEEVSQENIDVQVLSELLSHHIAFYLVTPSPMSWMADFGVFSNFFIALTMPLNAVLISFHAHGITILTASETSYK